MPEVDVGGVSLHVQCLGPDAGPRAPVVFLHGLVMDNLASWYFTVANPVSEHRRVILYDMRGHGRSARPAEGYGLDALVGELFGMLATQGITPPVHLVGHSFGGLLALAAATVAPSLVASLVLLDGLLPEAGWGERMAGTLSLEGDAADALIAERFQDWLGRHSVRKSNRLARQANQLVHKTSLLDDLRASASLPDASFGAIAAPVLLLYGADSDVRSHGERLARVLPHARLEIIAGSTHSLMWEQTEVVQDQLVAWLAEVQP